jgi:signal transduction histidine kinase
VSLRTRLLLSFAYVLVLVIVALEVPLGLNLSRRVDAEVKSEAESQAQLLAASAADRLSDRASLATLVRGAARDLGGRVIVTNSRGRLLVDSAGAGLRGTPYATRPEVASALAGRPAQGTRHSDSLDEELLFTAVPVGPAADPQGAVRVTQSVGAVHAEIRNDVLALVGVGLAALLLGLGVAWLLAGSLARPLHRLADTVRRLAGGNLDARAEVDGPSEQREVAAAFNDMADRLAASLRAQRDFVANASHQLRTPLTGLRLRLEAAALKSDDPGVERELAAAERETERLARLVSELMTLAREADGPPGEPLLLADAVEDACARWRGPAETSGHTLRAMDGDPQATALASRGDLAAILDNLVENALNYSPPGTTVAMEWGRSGGRAYVAVLDEGPGIQPDERERVFERFFRGHAGRDAPGTGLGLAVVEALAQRWEGEASLESRPSGGTRAEVRLPAVPEPPASLPNPEPPLERSLLEGP